MSFCGTSWRHVADRRRQRERKRNSNKNHFIFLEYQSCQLSRGLPRMEIGQILFLSQQQTKKSKNDILPVFVAKNSKSLWVLIS